MRKKIVSTSRCRRNAVRPADMNRVDRPPRRRLVGVVQWESRLDREVLRLVEWGTGVEDMQLASDIIAMAEL